MIKKQLEDIISVISKATDNSRAYVINGIGKNDKIKLINGLSGNVHIEKNVLVLITDNNKRHNLWRQYKDILNVEFWSVKEIINATDAALDFGNIIIYDAESFIINEVMSTDIFYKLLNILYAFKNNIIWCSCADVGLENLLKTTVTSREIESFDFDDTKEWVQNNMILFSDNIDNIKSYIGQKINAFEKVVFVSEDYNILNEIEKSFPNQNLLVMPYDYTYGSTVSCKEEALISNLCSVHKFPEGISLLLLHYDWLNNFIIDTKQVTTIVFDQIDGTKIIDIIKNHHFNSGQNLNLLIFLRNDVDLIRRRRYYDKMIKYYKEYIQHDGKLPSCYGTFVNDPGNIVCLRLGKRGGVSLGVDRCRLKHFQHMVESGLINSDDKVYKRYIGQSLNCDVVDLVWLRDSTHGY